MRKLALLILLPAALGLGGCDPRDCWLGIGHNDCQAQGSALAQFPRDDGICRNYGLTPGTHDYAICRQEKRVARDATERATDYGFLQNPLTPNVTTVAPAR